MISLGNIVVSRRTALRSAVFAGVYVASLATAGSPGGTASSSATPGPVDPSDATESLSLSEFVAVKTFAPDWSAEAITTFPRLLTFSPLEVESDCIVSWDARLFSVSESVLALTDVLREVSVEVTGEGSMKVRVPAGASSLLFDVQAINLYPAENIADRADTSVQLIGDGIEGSPVTLTSTVTQCAPWGLEVEADWAAIDGVILPSTVRLFSAGPNPVPASETVDLFAAGSLNGAMVSSSSPIAIIQPATGDRYALRAELRSGLAPQETATVTFPYVESDSTPRVNPSTVSGVLHTTPVNVVGMRMSGKAGAYPVTESGTPVSTFKAAPTA